MAKTNARTLEQAIEAHEKTGDSDADTDLEDATMPEEDLRAQLKAMRKRVKALETIKVDGPGRLTHHHDIERLFRLGLLAPEQVEAFRETGQLPPEPPKAA